MPNRRAHDHIGQLRVAGIREKEISQIIANMEAIVKQGISLADLEKVARNLVKNSKFKASFLKDPMDAVSQIGIMPGDNAQLHK